MARSVVTRGGVGGGGGVKCRGVSANRSGPLVGRAEIIQGDVNKAMNIHEVTSAVLDHPVHKSGL